ncbi:hypothetical protein NBRC116583_01890 [Arenicella sp. 4NH20-0111]|uniref:hypothetical protein n=1 Tax=Arenicella sp. 4NH20-0111 TaxID=3127648 RepID=UPI00310AF987
MNCTACKKGVLSPAYLDVMLPSHACNECGGVFLRMIDYFRWQEDNENIDLVANPPVGIHAEETSTAILCPKTGVLMTKYRISKDTEHRLDFSAAANAVWMDKGEWELLKTAGLATRLNNLFTSHWQHDIHAQESSEVMRELYARRFGEHYAALSEFRAVLDAMDDKHEAIAYLMAEDPYKP